VNLIEREFISRNGQSYEVTDIGLTYLDRYISLVAGRTTTKGKQSDLVRLTKDISKEARSLLSDYLSTMNPFKFEELIKFLLEEMGYSDVETTSPTNDKGVDVIAKIQLGISSVVEVVQAKRYSHNVRRNVLDELRGSLHRFNAVRATIITTGGFAKGTEQAAFERGAAPITLIDGQKLIDLLIEYEIGITKKSIEYFEFDPSKLTQFDTKEAVEPADKLQEF
jgi:restriction system protein